MKGMRMLVASTALLLNVHAETCWKTSCASIDVQHPMDCAHVGDINCEVKACQQCVPTIADGGACFGLKRAKAGMWIVDDFNRNYPGFENNLCQNESFECTCNPNEPYCIPLQIWKCTQKAEPRRLKDVVTEAETVPGFNVDADVFEHAETVRVLD